MVANLEEAASLLSKQQNSISDLQYQLKRITSNLEVVKESGLELHAFTMDQRKKELPTLAGFRDYETNDDEIYWNVGLFNAIEATYGEMMSWPTARFMDLNTGEIKEGSLVFFLDDIATSIKAGRNVKIEPLSKPL